MSVILVVLALLWHWPVGLAILALIVARRHYGWSPRSLFQFESASSGGDVRSERWERKLARAEEKLERRFGVGRGWRGGRTSGNSAFDDYRTETLRRLEDEQSEFKDFLARLRVAKDRAEFDQFMADRRQRPAETETQAGPSPSETRF
jgi:hypothetical protein